MDQELRTILSASPVWMRLYHTNPRYRKAWDEGRGPGQLGPQPPPTYGPKYNHWGPLHAFASKHAHNWNPEKAKAFYRRWQRDIPNKGCGCRSKWKRLNLKPDYTSAMTFFEFAWHAHKTVSMSIDKPTITLCECYATWWPECPHSVSTHPETETIQALSALTIS